MAWLVFAILAACGFGLRGILYHWTSQQPLSRNALLCGTFFSGAVISLICAILTGQQWSVSALIGLQMGLFSFGANASMFKGFAVGKASLVAILTALPSVVVVIVAYALWGEKLNAMQLAAFAVIIAGILLVRYSNDLSWGNLQGAQWGLLAMILFAGNDLSGKWSTMMEAAMFPTLVCMFAMGSACFGLWWLKDARFARSVATAVSQGNALGARVKVVSIASVSSLAERDEMATAKGRWSGKRTFAVGMAVGITNAVGMMFIITAFDLGKAGLVSAVAALNVLIVLLYTRFIVKERFSRLETIGIATAFAGILLMRLFGG
ncbi:EamA family transporter [Paenibacillus sp. NEAU-GSW1]|uniref:EamA family transporter n=1 Tax=Paenibacillus sp. NEAU-GSW1 TaxID=2682486 RepID=UPI0012E1A333|nr:EamA family transporter [Paenibacillus sp. NEAU-GSW1]MUT65284.1 EamA family transporter [Paenibacillus sp. NEAU-GSW1]